MCVCISLGGPGELVIRRRQRDQSELIQTFNSNGKFVAITLPKIVKTEENKIDVITNNIYEFLKPFKERRLKQMIPIYVARTKKDHQLNDSEYIQLLKKF